MITGGSLVYSTHLIDYFMVNVYERFLEIIVEGIFDN